MAPNAPVDLSALALPRLLRVLQVVAAALLGSQLLFLGIVVVLHQADALPSIVDPMPFYAVSAVFTATAVLVAVLMTNRMSGLRDGSDERLVRLRRTISLSVARLAVLEGAGIANIVFFLLTRDLVFLAAFVVCLLTFLIFRPREEIFDAFRDLSGTPPPIS